MPSHANLFVAKWYRNGRAYRPDGNLYKATEKHELVRRTLHVQSLQFALNETDDDIELLEPASELRQMGYEEGPARCRGGTTGDMNQGFVNPVPYSARADEWIDSCQFGWAEPDHFGGNRLAAVLHRFNPASHRYEWVENGPLLFYPDHPSIEASPIRWRDGFVIGARAYPHNQAANFLRLEDPFAPASAETVATTAQLPASGLVTAYACPDGVVRMFSGKPGAGRNPLFCTAVDPDAGFAVLDTVSVIDLLAAGLPLRAVARPVADMTKVLPFSGGADPSGVEGGRGRR